MDHRLQEIIDHFEIRKVLSIYCHGCDRGDAELMGSVYAKAGSYDDHGIIKAPGPEFARAISAIIKDTTSVISHMLGQSLIETSDVEARAETFFLATIAANGNDDEPRVSLLSGRFVDLLTREGESWRITNRTAVHDVSMTLRVEEDFLATNELVRGSRDASDLGAALLKLAHSRP